MSTSISKIEVELWDVEKIHPYDKNVKIHTESQVDALSKVIKSQGWDVPIVVDRDGVIIKGHGRRLAALKLGLAQVPVICRRDMSEDEVRAARLSDNRVALGDFDVDMMREELASLQSTDFDMTSLGFDSKELEMMLGQLDEMNNEALQGDRETMFTDTPPPTPSSEPTPAPQKVRPFQVTEVLGFKSVPGEFRDALVKFQAHAEQETGSIGAAAFGALIQSLVSEMEKAS
jgi:hypothetical protein